MKLFTKLSLAFLVISSLVFIVGLVSTNTSQKALEQVIAEKYILLAEMSLSDIHKAFSRYIADFQMLANDPLLQNLAKESNNSFEQMSDMQKFIDETEEDWRFVSELGLVKSIEKLINNPASMKLKERMEFYQRISGVDLKGNIFITNKYGAIIALTSITSAYYQGDNLWWKMARDQELWVGDVNFNPYYRIYSIDVGIKIQDEKGDFLGVMNVDWDIEEAMNTVKGLSNSMAVAPNTDKNKKAYLPKFRVLTLDGRTIYASQDYKMFEKISSKVLEEKVLSEKNGYCILDDANGEEILFAYARSKDLGKNKGLDWIILVEHKTSDIFKMITNIRNTIMIISILGLIIAVVIGFFIASSIFKPIKKLQQAAALIGTGNMDVKIDIDSNSAEVGALADSFRIMIANLKKTTTSVETLNQEITERKRVESTLRESEERFKNLFESARDLILITDLTGTITGVNKAVERYGFKKEDMIGKKEIIFAASEYQQQLIDDMEKIKAGVIARGERAFLSPKGNIMVDYCNNPIFKGEKIIGMQSVMRDISNLKELENAQRLAQLGKFVAAMAHEVKNPLMIISGRIQMALMENIENKEMKNSLETAFNECQRAKDIINRLLKFSKPAKGEAVKIEVNKIIKEIINILKHQFSLEGITINCRFADALPMVVFDPKQLQEVVMNLLTNARDAIVPEKGTIDIITSKEGDKVKIEVKDSGMGMETETMQNILSPFWTTKAKGTGLGLSISYSIVRDHGGLLNFESAPGEGTAAMIILPLA